MHVTTARQLPFSLVCVFAALALAWSGAIVGLTHAAGGGAATVTAAR